MKTRYFNTLKSMEDFNNKEVTIKEYLGNIPLGTTAQGTNDFRITRIENDIELLKEANAYLKKSMEAKQ